MSKLLTRVAVILTLTISAAASAAADAHLYWLHVDGLACPYCAYGVEKQVGGLADVLSVEIRIDEGIVVVTMAAGKILDQADASRAVSDAGFSLRKFEPAKDR